MAMNDFLTFYARKDEKIASADPKCPKMKKWCSITWGGYNLTSPTNYTVCSVYWCVRHVLDVKFDFQQLSLNQLFSKCRFGPIIPIS